MSLNDYDKMQEKITVSIEEASLPKSLHKWIQDYALEYKTTLSDVLGEIFWVFREYKATDLK